ncbi:MAG: hypothetical protein M1813_002976 [Trichoglossum hirsutum]|nr:MAG: hypothetical protein M1813_002976 [Trichoglossum hirsutum]
MSRRHSSPTTCWVLFLLTVPALCLADIPVADSSLPDVSLSRSPSQIFGRQSSACGSCSGKCCGDECIASNLACCQGNPTPIWCTLPSQQCAACPSGQTCYAHDIVSDQYVVSPWACCTNGVCPFLVASGSSTLVVTVGSSSTQTSTSTSSTTRSSTSTSTASTTSSTTTPDSTTSSPSSSKPSSSKPSVILFTPTTRSTTPIVTTPLYGPPITYTPTPTPTSTSHSSVPRYTFSGDLLVGYCATAEYTGIVDGSNTAIYYVPIVGCVSDKPDCCPTSTSTTTETVTNSVTGGQYYFPGGSTSQIDLPSCPDDYETVASGCCPSGYLLWDSILGGATPCYSTLTSYAEPPPNDYTPTVTLSGIRTTSTVVNVVYAMHYPVTKKAPPRLRPEAKVGIGVGAAAGALAGSGLLYLLWRRYRKRRRDEPLYPSEPSDHPSTSNHPSYTFSAP